MSEVSVPLDAAPAPAPAPHSRDLLLAAVYGSGAAVAGAALWAAVVHYTEHQWGLLSIAVGLLVGLAVRKASRARGGWRYQAVAMALTYASVALAYVPEVILAQQQKAGEVAMGTGQLLSVGLLMPYFVAREEPVTLLFLGIALYEAWKVNRGAKAAAAA